jgi:hypothetical protein
VRAFASAVIAGIILLFSAGSAQAAFPGKNGLIAYERGGGIWLMRSDGSSKHQIAASAFDPSWSPSGKKITFDRGCDVWVMNADGSAKTQVTKAASCETRPAWSADGKWLYFDSDRSAPGTGADGIYKLRSTVPFGSVITVVAPPHFGFAIDPAVAANGTLAYYLDTDDTEPFTCCFIRTRAGTTDKAIGGCLCYGAANWGPGSKTLAYAIGIEDPNDPFALLGSEIATIRSDGSNRHLLPRPNGTTHYYDSQPAWAPAGTWMVFGERFQTDTVDSDRGIWKMRGDGTGGAQLAAVGADPDWQPIP